MRNKEYKHIGKKVSRAVRDAIRSGNFEDIGRVVENGVHEFTDDLNTVFDEHRSTRRQVKNSYAQYAQQNGTMNNGGYPPPQQVNTAYQKPVVHSAFRNRMPGGISGLVYSIIGASMGIPLMIADITVFSVGFVGFMPREVMTLVVSILTPMMVGTLWLMNHGITLRRRARRFARYREVMGSAKFSTLAELSDTSGEPLERTKKDVKKMITSGACPKGHLSRDGTCFMVDDDTYYAYLEAEKAYAARTEAEKLEEQKEEKNPKDAELSAAQKEGSEYLQKIRAARNALSGLAITEKLYRLENVTARIFSCVEQHPDKLHEIRRFMRYYLPTTLKLVQSYEEFERQPMQGENITKAKEEIERSFDTINNAFGNLLDTLYADDALNVSADISTLETMLKQEGLTGSDFTKAPEDDKFH